MTQINLDIETIRGDAVESRHRVHAAVVDAAGELLMSAGDPGLVTFWRSCAKPFQVMPLLRRGHFDTLGWGADELALACASHGGEPEHVAIARSMLESLELDEGDLACGPHEPLTRRGTRLADRSGEPLSRLHNNCSGKHAAMLALATGEGWPLLGYEQRGHQVQEAAADAVAEWTGVPRGALLQAVDGCGVVTFGLPLAAMARSFARLASCARIGDAVPARIVEAMRTRPFLVGGTDRFDTVLMEETDGSVVSKVGAEGVHTVGIVEEGVGIAIKVEDGASRAQHPAVIRTLQLLGVLGRDLPPRLASFLEQPIVNTRGEVVGTTRPVARA
ncbi:MAG TPA: asparaginase [Gemmatimonadaceae bacterium]|nr:asparaginase [Gemmatimonadaceae bacterium]